MFALMDSELIAAKVRQATGLLDEFDIDLWVVFVRETTLQRDPAMSLVVGTDVAWQSFFAYHRSGRSVALVGYHDREDFARSGVFSEIRTYTQDIRDDLLDLLHSFNPATIAFNYSRNDPAADGLTHGMHSLLQEYLESSPFADRIVSAERLHSALRARKLTEETERLHAAAFLAADAWKRSLPDLAVGMTEREVAAVIERNMATLGSEPSFPTIVNAGDKTAPGHGSPTDARIEAGDLLHVDFGARLNGYCSDLQRLLYFFRKGETAPPPELAEAFETVRTVIDDSAKRCVPGARGFEIDAAARRHLTDHGYDEYQHALGHQLGQAVHDGGAILGPKWHRYGVTPEIPLEINNVFTLELEILLPGIGCVGLEEDVCVTERGARFLCPRQTELTCK
jgi:Xaa-Pro aminopeptidase